MCSCLLSCMQVSIGKENREQVIKCDKGSTSNARNEVGRSSHAFIKKKWDLSLGMKVESRFFIGHICMQSLTLFASP
jgi:hypothetical protein